MNEEDKAVVAELRRKMPSLADKSDEELMAVLGNTFSGALARLAVAFKAFLIELKRK